MISAAVLNCSKLKVLRLTQSRVEDAEMRKIIKNICCHPVLETLDLKHNRLRDKTGRALGKLIAVSKSLLELDIEDNEIGVEGCGAIAHALKKDSSLLQQLNISQNMVADQGGILLCQALEVNKRLTHLKIAANGLGEAFGKSMSGEKLCR